jgi:drug/metabolite transporter (DMT)-like permease
VRSRDLIDYASLSLIWGLSFTIVVRVAGAFGWVGAVTLRALVAGGSLLLLAAVTRRRLDLSAGWRPFAVVGATTVAAQLVGLSFAAPRIGTAMAAILVATIPLFSAGIAHAWGLAPLTGRTLAGVLLGGLGVVLLVGFPAVPVTPTFVLGVALALLGSAAAAFGSNYAHARLRDVGSYEVTTAAFLLGGLMTLPLLLAVPIPTTPGPDDYLLLLLLGSVMSALAYVLYFRLVADWGATRAISVEFVVTLIAVLVGALLLHEPLTAVQLVGGAVILVGCALALGLLPSRAARRPA